MTIDVTVPRSWTELTQEQLRFLLSAMVSVNRACANIAFPSREAYIAHTVARVQTICFLEWTGITLVTPYASGYLFKYGDQEFTLPAAVLASALTHLEWIRLPPSEPVRLDIVDGAEAIPADLSSGLSFDSWLTCETLWQRYQHTPDDTLLWQMAAILYRKEDIRPDPAATLGIFFWWAGVKNLVSLQFPDFFKKIPDDDEPLPPSYEELRRDINAQIRALTKGDITKEQEILAFDAMRALTELDAQAREYDELNRKYSKT